MAVPDSIIQAAGHLIPDELGFALRQAGATEETIARTRSSFNSAVVFYEAIVGLIGSWPLVEQHLDRCLRSAAINKPAVARACFPHLYTTTATVAPGADAPAAPRRVPATRATPCASMSKNVLYEFAVTLTTDEIRLLLDLMGTPAGQVHRIVHATRPDMGYVDAVSEHFATPDLFVAWMQEQKHPEAARIRDSRLMPNLHQ